MSKEFYEKLAKIQRGLNAPKKQRNTFGGYNYRSCEDILEAVKPLLDGLFLSITDEVVMIGERFYVKATATITDGESSHSSTAMAREELTKKGMDAAQITGATSSYARKYCLNGLFGIDDTKDADTDEHKNQIDAKNAQQDKTLNNKQLSEQKKKHSPDEILSRFTEAANTMNLIELSTAYNWSFEALTNSPEHQSKLTDVYTIRKEELEAA
ncbi:MAG: ERF family protein [Hafnia sp.]